MRAAFPNASVNGYQHLIAAMTNDAKDRHVAAAAVRGNAALIVTANLRDFPPAALEQYDIEAVHEDANSTAAEVALRIGDRTQVDVMLPANSELGVVLGDVRDYLAAYLANAGAEDTLPDSSRGWRLRTTLGTSRWEKSRRSAIRSAQVP